MVTRSCILILLILLTRCYFIAYADGNCVSTDYIKVHNFKSIINTRLNIISLKCDYITVQTELKPNDSNEKSLSHQKAEGTNQRFSAYINGNFICQNGNFRKTIIYPEEEKNETPNNLFELLALKLNPKKDTTQRFQQEFYFYKGTLKAREYRYDDFLGYHYWEIVHDNFDPFSLFYDPLVSIGHCHGVGYRGNSWMENNITFNIKDFLDEEGNFYYYEQDRYKILWHGVFKKHPQHPGFEPISIEVWLDEKENISMISYIFFPYRFNKKIVNDLMGGYVNCNFPYISYWKFYYYDHKEFMDGISIPLRTKIEHYKLATNPCIEEKMERHQIQMQDKNVDINDSAFIAWTLLSLCEDPTYIDEIQEVIIYPDSIIINENLPEEIFIAPKPDIPVYWTEEEQEKFFKERLEKNSSATSQKKLRVPTFAFIFVTSCVLITLLGMFLTKHYCGWGS